MRGLVSCVRGDYILIALCVGILGADPGGRELLGNCSGTARELLGNCSGTAQETAHRREEGGCTIPCV